MILKFIEKNFFILCLIVSPILMGSLILPDLFNFISSNNF